MNEWRDRLIQINTDDLLTSFGLQHVRFGWQLLRWACRPLAARFADQVLDYDAGVNELGLRGGAQRLLRTYIAGVETKGVESIPAKGPVLLVSNHPGLTDTVCLFSAIPREDLRVLAADRPFLRALPATSRSLIFIPESGDGRAAAIRQTAAFLRSGGAVLTFPAGEIEPDPAVLPGAVKSLDAWAASIGFFARMVPALKIVPVIVSGVLHPSAVHHPITRLRRRQVDRERLGATLQILAREFSPRLWAVRPRVEFLQPLPASNLINLHNPELITRAVTETMRPILLAYEASQKKAVKTGLPYPDKLPRSP